MTPKSIGFQVVTYVVNMCDMVIVEFVDLEKISGETNKQTKNRQTNEDEKTIVAVQL